MPEKAVSLFLILIKTVFSNCDDTLSIRINRSILNDVSFNVLNKWTSFRRWFVHEVKNCGLKKKNE